MRALIVDDEPIARRVLREELEQLPGIDVIAEASNGQAALQAIEREQPDLVFADLQMPGMNGLQMIENITGPAIPVVVVVTAYDQYAIRAFEAGAIDYLLKPVSAARLEQTVERARRLLRSPAAAAENLLQIQDSAPSQQEKRIRKIVGRLGEEYFLLDLQEILAFQADGDITWIITARQRYFATQNLKAIEQRLSGSSFERIHRSALINIDHIRKLSVLSSQRWLITLTNGQELVVSKRLANRVRPFLHW